MKTIVCYVAGDSRSNPGAGAMGVYITDESGTVLHQDAQTIGNTTTNFAVYSATLHCLEALQIMYGSATKTIQFEIRLDNELVKKQLNAELPLTDPGLVPMFIEIHNRRVMDFPNVHISLITSDENKVVLNLVKEVLDGRA